jgi:hypothetical protein
MTRLEKSELLKEFGYTYNPDTGDVIGLRGNVIKRKDARGYIKIGRDDLFIGGLFAHQFAWYYINNEIVDCIDHINGIKSDNRICNLRSITRQQNTFNTNAKGYHYDSKKDRWRPVLTINGKKKYFGRYKTEKEASDAYLQLKQKYHIIF